MKRELFVFAGQSNMMGAAALPPKYQPKAENSFEYKCISERFVPARHPAGQFVYIDEKYAYAPENTDSMGRSTVADYTSNTYFIGAARTAKDENDHAALPFVAYSESTVMPGVSLPPVFAEDWERAGHVCSYIHLAKGSAKAEHYFGTEMKEKYDSEIAEYNARHGTAYPEMKLDGMCIGASLKFKELTRKFFTAAKKEYKDDDISERVFVWNQGESNVGDSVAEYKLKLKVLWESMRPLGFTKFFCIRVGFWGRLKISDIMQAEEEFCAETPDAFMLSRELSRIPLRVEWGEDNKEFFGEIPGGDHEKCRDIYYGHGNPHYNELGFTLLSRDFSANADRILYRGLSPELGDEPVAALREK